MHGTYEANLAMHGCDVMINIGARFDDRVTGKLTAFSPGSKKIHVDIDPTSINKNVRVDLPIVGDAGARAGGLIAGWKAERRRRTSEALKEWWAQIEEWRGARLPALPSGPAAIIKPQYALERLYELTQEAATPTSPPRSASTRCGRRSSSASRSRTAG